MKYIHIENKITYVVFKSFINILADNTLLSYLRVICHKNIFLRITCSLSEYSCVY